LLNNYLSTNELSNTIKMKKSIIILLLSFITALTVNSQSPLRKGNQQFNAGLGFSGWGVPIYIGLDFGVQRDFTLGIEGSFRSYSQKFPEAKYHSSIIGLSGNGNYHFNRILEIPGNWDLYAGLNIGYYLWYTPSDYPGPYSSGLGLGAQIGGRYFFSHNFGLNLEFGGGNAFSGGKFGITYIF
jgi:outer membrane immunogenic protein